MLARLAIGLILSATLLPASFVAHAAHAKKVFYGPLKMTTQTGVAYSPSDIDAAYDITPLRSRNISGASQTIALVEFDHFTTGDLHAFDVANHLSDPKLSYFYAGGKSFTVPVLEPQLCILG